MNIQCCYNNRIEDFLQEDGNTWIETMKSTSLEMSDLPLEESQIRAWKDCFKVLKEQLPEIATAYPGFDIVFEYVLPYESGRRPDVLLICKEKNHNS